MPFALYFARRTAHSILILLGLSILIFLIARVMPGDPARMALGARAPEDVVQKWREWMHLDDPLYIQYYHWIRNAVRGDLGMSLYTRRNVAIDIKTFLPATMELILFAGLLSATFALLLGATSARYKNSWIDNTVRAAAYFAVATPSFVIAIFLLLLFGYVLEALPTMGRLSEHISSPPTITGMITVDSIINLDFRAFLNALKHLVMPGIALALGSLAQEARITRSSMIDNAEKDYITAERCQGIPERVIYLKYLLKPSVIATVSIMGLDFAALLGNAFIVEVIFGWPGLSSYGINAMLNNDLNPISAVTLTVGVVFITVNLIVDVIVAYLDPRIRLREEE